MNIICPKCSSVFLINESLEIKEGQKLKCSACQHKWHFKDEQNDNLLQKEIANKMQSDSLNTNITNNTDSKITPKTKNLETNIQNQNNEIYIEASKNDNFDSINYKNYEQKPKNNLNIQKNNISNNS